MKSCKLPECGKLFTIGYGSCCCRSHMGKYAAKKGHGTLGLPNKPSYIKKNNSLSKEERKQRQKVWQRISTRNYQARKKQAYPCWADKTEIRKVYELAEQKTIETGIKHEVDHIIPLAGKSVCGLHVHFNLQVLTKEENRKKFNYLLL